jgi:hypothetical protein
MNAPEDQPYVETNPRRDRRRLKVIPSDRYRDVFPPEGWQPKSDHFKAIWRHAQEKYDQEQFNLRNPRVTMICPYCDHEMVVRISPVPTSSPT